MKRKYPGRTEALYRPYSIPRAGQIDAGQMDAAPPAPPPVAKVRPQSEASATVTMDISKLRFELESF